MSEGKLASYIYMCMGIYIYIYREGKKMRFGNGGLELHLGEGFDGPK